MILYCPAFVFTLFLLKIDLRFLIANLIFSDLSPVWFLILTDLIVAVFLSLSVSLFAQKGGDIGGVTLDPCAGGGVVLIGEPLPTQNLLVVNLAEPREGGELIDYCALQASLAELEQALVQLRSGLNANQAQILTDGYSENLYLKITSLIRQHRMHGSQAADFFTNPVLRTAYEYASVDDNILGESGHDQLYSMSVSGDLGDDMFLLFSYDHGRYDIDGVLSEFLQLSDSYSLFLGMSLSEDWTLGVFGSYSAIDVESFSVTSITLPVSLEYNVDRVGAGILLSYNHNIDAQTDLGITTSIASLNKNSLNSLFNNEDSIWLLSADLYHRITDSWAIDPYISYSTLLDREFGAPDGDSYNLGGDVIWTINQDWAITVGYSTVMSDSTRDEHRFRSEVAFNF